MNDVQRSLHALQEDLRAHSAQQALRIRQMERQLAQMGQKLRKANAARDQWKARAAELRGYVTKYQKEIVQLRERKTKCAQS